MSRLTRALGFGDGDKRSAPRADSPKVRRLRETMRWRGYDLSEYTDEQIEAVSARFPNDISEDGETTEDGRRSLAAALERGDFTQTPPAAAPDIPASAPEPPAAEPSVASAYKAPASPTPGASFRRTLGMPTVTERLAHVFGVHAWRPIEDGEAPRMQCVGCGQMRNEPIPFRPPPPPPQSPPSEQPPLDEPIAKQPPSRSPLDDLPNVGERDPLADRDPLGNRDPLGRRPRPRRSQQSDSVFQFIMGLPWWSKLLGIFILIQVIGLIISSIGG